jgi:hypothetical protein
MVKRIAGKWSLNTEGAIACYRSALAVWTKDGEVQQWTLTQLCLGDSLGDLRAGEKGISIEACIHCYQLYAWTRDVVPMNWASTYLNLANALWSQ